MDLAEFHEWLSGEGFRTALNGMRSQWNECEWYAYRRSSLEARRCESNDDKPGVQIIIYPYQSVINVERHTSVEVEICGEAAGVWWKLRVYALQFGELIGRLPEIEAALVAAWNAIPIPTTTPK